MICKVVFIVVVSLEWVPNIPLRADTGTVVNIAHRVESESNQRISPLLAACETMLKQIWIKFAPTAETDATQSKFTFI